MMDSPHCTAGQKLTGVNPVKAFCLSHIGPGLKEGRGDGRPPHR